MNEIIGKRYIIGKKLGNGNFCSVYKGHHRKTNAEVAIKLESDTSIIKLLQHETTVLKYLYERDVRNIPAISWYGKSSEYTCLVMSIYDCSLYDYILSKKEITVSKIQSIVYQLIDIFRVIHDNGVIHRDVKPQNIMVKNGELFLIDFGFSTFYIDEDGEHCQNSCSECIIGSPKYVSYYIHSGSISSRRDDLISLGYLYLFLYNKTLPWENITTDSTLVDEYDETSIFHYKNLIRQKQKEIDMILPLCKEIDSILCNYVKYVYSLEYDQIPNYNAILNMFQT